MTSRKPLIVVGVDGSEASNNALRWAARQAELTDAELQVIIAWRPPTTYGVPADYSEVDFEGEARKTVDAAVGKVLGAQPAVPVLTRVIAGHAAPALMDAAREADLLVVGSHGHGTFTGMLLGSTSQHCVHHSPCPVVVVRGRTDKQAPDDTVAASPTTVNR